VGPGTRVHHGGVGSGSGPVFGVRHGASGDVQGVGCDGDGEQLGGDADVESGELVYPCESVVDGVRVHEQRVCGASPIEVVCQIRPQGVDQFWTVLHGSAAVE